MIVDETGLEITILLKQVDMCIEMCIDMCMDMHM